MPGELSVAVMPEMVDRDFSRHALSIGPRKATRVLADMKGFRGISRRSPMNVTFLRVLRCGKRLHPLVIVHGKDKVVRDSSTMSRVGEHHSFLHRPCVVSVYESDKAIVTILAPRWMSSVNWFAFDEESVKFRQHFWRLKIVITQFETQIGRFRSASSVEIGNFTLSND